MVGPCTPAAWAQGVRPDDRVAIAMRNYPEWVVAYWAGIVLDESLNQSAKGEARISAGNSRTQIWVLPTNEEIVVARQAVEAVKGKV